MAPYLSRSAQIVNIVSAWVTFSIVSQEDLEKRVKILKLFIHTMDELRELRSLNMLMALMGAILNATIGRLTKTFDELKKETVQVLEVGGFVFRLVNGGLERRRPASSNRNR